MLNSVSGLEGLSEVRGRCKEGLVGEDGLWVPRSVLPIVGSDACNCSGYWSFVCIIVFSPLGDLEMVTLFLGSWVVQSTLCFVSFRIQHPAATRSNNATRPHQRLTWPSPSGNHRSLTGDTGRLQIHGPNATTAPSTTPAPHPPVESSIATTSDVYAQAVACA